MLVSGGVQSPGRVAHEPSHQVKTALAMTQKAAIGKLAASLVQPGSCIYLDAGTTTLAIAQASDSHGVTDCGHKRFRYCGLLARQQ
ncbi:DeoR family transcriptional regulator [Escherichia coli]|nr:DeoR family transcriptional regulator [Escherichia coli]